MSLRPVHGRLYAIGHVQRALGQHPNGGGLSAWLRRQGVLNGHTQRHGKYRLISVAVLQDYLEATDRPGVVRVSNRPRGWIGLHAACERIGCSPSFVWASARRGRLRAARVGHVHFYHPADCDRLRLELGHLPPPGWVQLSDVVGESDVGSAKRWLEKRGHEVRSYRRREDRQDALFVREDAASAWRAGVHRRLTPEQTREIRARRTAGEKRADLAHEYGVTPPRISQIAGARRPALYEHRLVSGHGLTPLRAPLVLLLAQVTELTEAELVAVFGVPAHNQLRTLVRHGLARALETRPITYELTESGRALVEVVRVPLRAIRRAP